MNKCQFGMPRGLSDDAAYTERFRNVIACIAGAYISPRPYCAILYYNEFRQKIPPEMFFGKNRGYLFFAVQFSII